MIVGGISGREEYQADRFCGTERRAKADEICGIAIRAANGEKIGRRIFHFIDNALQGKTWMLHHIEATLQQDGQRQHALAVFIDLETATDHPDPPQYAQGLLIDLLKCMDCYRSLPMGDYPASVHQLVQLLEGKVEKLRAEGMALVLLVDNLHKASQALLEALEAHILGPLSYQPNAIIILAGRRYRHLWEEPRMQLPDDLYKAELPKFKDADIVTQLKLHALDQPDPMLRAAIEEIAQDSPGFVALIIQKYEQDPTGIGDHLQIVQEIYAILLRDVPEEYRRYMEALCILLDLHDDGQEALPLLEIHFPEQQWSVNTCKAVIRMFKQPTAGAALLLFDKQRYHFDERVRQLAELELKLRDHQHWHALHKAAFDLYREWATKHSQPTFAEKARYHEVQWKQML